MCHGYSQLWQLCHVIQSDILTVFIVKLIYFHLSIFPFQLWLQLEWLFHLLQSPVPLQFLLPSMVIATDVTPNHWAFFIFQVIYVIKVVQYPFFFPDWPVGYWIWPTSAVLLLFQYTFLPISVWKLIICYVDGCFQCDIFFLTLPKQHFSFGVYQRWICWLPNVPLNVSIIIPQKIWGLGVECIQPSLDISGKLSLSSSYISLSSSVHVSGRKCHCLIQTFDSIGTTLDRGSLASHSTQHAADIPWCCLIIKDVIMDVLVGQVL